MQNPHYKNPEGMKTSEKLLDLASFLEGIPKGVDTVPEPGERTFHMDTFAGYAVDDNDNICGTCACIAGWAVLRYTEKPITPEDVDELDFDGEANEILGLDQKHGDVLYYGHFTRKPMNAITEQDAAEELRRLAGVYAEDGR